MSTPTQNALDRQVKALGMLVPLMGMVIVSHSSGLVAGAVAVWSRPSTSSAAQKLEDVQEMPTMPTPTPPIRGVWYAVHAPPDGFVDVQRRPLYASLTTHSDADAHDTVFSWVPSAA